MRWLLLYGFLITAQIQAAEVGVRWEPDGVAFLPQQPILFQAANLECCETLTFTWQFSDGATASGEEVTHAFAQPGRYQVTTLAADENGVLLEPVHSYVFINAADGPLPDDWGGYVNGVIHSGAPDTNVVTIGDTIAFQSSGYPTNENFFWQIGRTDITQQGPSFNWRVPDHWPEGYTTITLFTVHPDGTANPYPSQEQVYIYRETAPPNAFLIDPVAEDLVYRTSAGQPITFTAASNNASDIFTWDIVCRGDLVTSACSDWDLTDSGPFTGSTFTFEPTQPGYYQLDLTAVSETGVADPFPVSFVVLVRGENHPPEGRITSPSQVINIGQVLELQGQALDPDYDPTTLHWNLGDGRLETGESITTAYTTAGAYLVQMTAADSAGLEDASPYGIWVLVNDPTIAPFNQQALAAIQKPARYCSHPVNQPIDFEGFISDPEDPQAAQTTAYWDLEDGEPASGTLTFQRAFQQTNERRITLFARDSDGWFSQQYAATFIHLYSGDRPPPVGIITGPVQRESPDQELRVTIRTGESVQFEGAVQGVTDLTGYTARWAIYEEPFTRVLEGFHPQPAVFNEPGAFYVEFAVTDPNNQFNPFFNSILVVVLDDLPPEVQLIEPGYNRSLKVSDGISLAAQGCDPEGGALTYQWALSDGQTFSGERVEWVTFAEPGLYRINLSVTDEAGQTTAADPPATVIVLPDSARTIWDGPSVLPLAPLQDTLGGPAGSAFNFAVAPADVAGIPFQGFFWDFGDGRTSRESAPGRIQFDQPGYYPIQAYVLDQDGLWSTSPYTWTVVIHGDNTPPVSTITQPARRNSPYERRARTIPVLKGATLSLAGTAEDVDGNYPLTLEWTLDYQPYHIGPNPPALQFQEVGSHVLSLRAIDAAGGVDGVGDERFIRVVDPELKPTAYIDIPDEEITVEPGAPIVFRGYGVDPNDLELNYEWRFGGDAQPATATTSKVYPVVFTSETPPDQPHQVQLWVHTELTQSEAPAVVRVHVKQHVDSDFEPNDQLEQAAEIGQGSYSQLSVGDDDAGDFFAFEVARAQRDLQITLSSLDRLEVTVYRFVDGGWHAMETVRDVQAETITLQNPGAGRYICHIQGGDALAAKRGLTYTLALQTLQPALYLPFLTDDGSLNSFLGLVNPLEQEAELVILGIDESGETLETVTMSLGPKQRLYQDVTTFFDRTGGVDLARRIRWVKVLAPSRVVGFTNAETYDHSQLMSAGAAKSLSAAVLTPHVAERTQTWYTRAVLVNGSESGKTVDLETPIEGWSAGKTQAGGQIDFRFQDLFPTLPPWGRFKEADGQPGLAGFEMFGRSDGFKQLAALEMIPTLTRNPNFVYESRNIYFTHVADQALFWTGIALINTQAQPTVYHLVGYDQDGAELIRFADQTLEPGQKLLSTTQQLFGELPVAWIAAESDVEIAGFELFGDAEGRLLAGFPAAGFAADELIFPHVDIAGGRSWTGIAVLNLSTTAVTVDARAYDDVGREMAAVSLTLDPRTKLVRTPRALFPGIAETVATIIMKTATPSLAGFELFGSLNPDGSLGEQLAGLPSQTP